MKTEQKIRNIAVIAHVDHGKTTLVDAFIKQTHIFRQNQEEMRKTQILDSNELEQERGITIQAKYISVSYENCKINIIDTPGHADFVGEVERTLNMADGAILIVDAQEGVMPQTKFVLKKAFEMKLKIIVVVNKIDKKLANPDETVKKIQDLFLTLATESEQLDFPVFYAIGREGKVFTILPENKDFEETEGNVLPLLDAIIEYIPEPENDTSEKFSMIISAVDFDPHYGRYLIGKISTGRVSVGKTLYGKNSEKSDLLLKGRVRRVCYKKGLEYADLTEGVAGDIVAIAGIDEVSIGDTLLESSTQEPQPKIIISPPSLKIKFEANTSPFLGKEGTYANLKQLQQRLEYEKQVNVSLDIDKNADGSYYVSGRGELHLGILIETLRREGFEFQVRKPEVVIHTNSEGKRFEPKEEAYIEVDEEYYSAITEEMNQREAEMINIESKNGRMMMSFYILTRNLIGLQRFINLSTKGSGVLHTQFHELVPFVGESSVFRKGSIVSTATGKSLGYALNSIQERGDLFIEPNTDVYEGMIIGINKYEDDLFVNPTKSREKTNVRTSHAVLTLVSLKPTIQLTLEFAIGFLVSIR
ncbi:MAG TPA: GTP-binding protein [bacterium]|nr:GTP-binding protein [bacterium]